MIRRKVVVSVLICMVALSGAASAQNLTVVRHADNSLWAMTCDGVGTCSVWTQIPGTFAVQPTLTWDPSIQKYILIGAGGAGNIKRATFNADGTFNNDWVKIGTTPSPVALAAGQFGGAYSSTAAVPPANAKLQVITGDAAVTAQGRGLILRAADGPNCFRLTVDNTGALSTNLIPCP